MKKIISVLLVLSLCLCFAACGSEPTAAPTQIPEVVNPTDEPADPTEPAPQGNENITWGNISIYVPEGFELSGGLPGDGENPDGCIIMDSHDINKRVTVKITTQSEVDNKVSVLKAQKGATEIERFTIGSTTWSGVTYKADGLVAYALFGDVNGKTFYITSFTLELDDAAYTDILGSIKPL